MEKDRNLLFGVLAVQLGKVTSGRLMKAAAAWAMEPTRPLDAVLVDDGAITGQDRDLIDRFVEEAIRAHSGDARATLNTFGGEARVMQTFGGTVSLESRGATPAHRTSAVATPLPTDTGVLEAPGRYRLVSEQGRGGYGRVLLVHDEYMVRDVALKELIPESDSGAVGSRADTQTRRTAEAVARFLQEARITGQLEHPSIVPVYELGHREDGALYYTMKLVRGQTLSTELSKRATFRERLELLPAYLNLCQAMAYAHDRGVIHRDIKPDNVMIGSFGETVVIDWGLAKVKGRADVHALDLKETVRMRQAGESSPTATTLYGTILGTPHFMAPEQARGDVEHIDERSDVYALGAVLYVLLTGKRPYENAPLQNVILHINLPPLTPVSKLAPDAPPELITVCMKALETDPANRYQHAGALAQEIQRFMSGALVTSHQYTLRDQLRRFVRRHKAPVATVAVAAAALVIIGIISYVQIIRANARERSQRIAAERAEALATEKGRQEAEARSAAEYELYISNIRLAYQSIEENQFDLARALLAACPKAHRHFEWGWLQSLCNEDLATLKGHGAPIQCIALSTDGHRLASADVQSSIRFWDLPRGEEIRSPLGVDGSVTAMAYSPDDAFFAAVGNKSVVVVRAADTMEPAFELSGHESAINDIAFSPDGRLLATASSDDTARIWSVETRKPIAVLSEHLNDVVAIAWSPGQGFLVTGGLDNAAYVWDTSDWTVSHRLAGHQNDVTCAAVSPDSSRIATGGADGQVIMWDSKTGKQIACYPIGPDIHDLSFSGDGDRLAVATAGPVAYVIDTRANAECRFSLRGHSAEVAALAFIPGQELIVTGGADHTVKLWYAPKHFTPLLGSEPGASMQEIYLANRDFNLWSFASTMGTCTVFDSSNGAPVAHMDDLGHSGLGRRLWLFAPDSSFLLFAGDDNRPKLFQMPSKTVLELDLKGSPFYPGLSNDGSLVAISTTSGDIEFFDTKTGRPVRAITAARPGNHLLPVFSPDDKFLAVGFLDVQQSDLALFEMESARERWRVSYPRTILDVMFSSNGDRVYVSGEAGLRVYSAANGEDLTSRFDYPTLWLNTIASTPDDARLVAETRFPGFLLFDTRTGREVLRFNRTSMHSPAAPLYLTNLFFDRDGTALHFVADEWQGPATFDRLKAMPWSEESLPGTDSMPLDERIERYKRERRAARLDEAIRRDRSYAWLHDEVSGSRGLLASAPAAENRSDPFANATVREFDVSPGQWTMLLQMGRSRLKQMRDILGYRGMKASSDLVLDRSLAEFLAVLGFQNNDIIVRINDSSTPGYDMFIEALEQAQRQDLSTIYAYFYRAGKPMVHVYYRTEASASPSNP